MIPVPTAKAPRPVASVPLKAFLARLIWLCLLPLLVVAAWLAYQNVHTSEELRDEGAASLARSYAISVDQRLNAQIRALKMMAGSPLLDDPKRWPDLYREAQRFEEIFGSHVILADAGDPMRMLFNTRAPYGSVLPPLPQPNGHAAATDALATGRPAVGDSFMGPVAKERLVAIAVPVLRDGAAKVVLLATPEAHQFQGRLDQMALPPGWAMSVIDGSGEVIARRAPPAFDAARDVRPDGRFVARSEVAPWSVVVEIPHHVHRAPLYAAVMAFGIGLLGATLAGVVGGRLASRRLTRAVASLAEGSDHAAPDPDIAEIRAAKQRLDGAVNSLRESEARFRRLFQDAPLAMGHVRGDGVIVAVNARFEKLFGYTPVEIPTIDHWWGLAYPDPDYSAQVVAGWSAAVQRAETAGGDIEPNEYRVTCRNGSQRVVQISGIRVEDGVLAAFVDMTERRRAEGALRALNDELEQVTRRHVASQTVAAIAHELNQPLTALATYTEAALRLLRAGNPQPGRLEHALESGAQQAQRAGRVARELLEFLRKGEVQTANVALIDIVRAAAERVRTNHPSKLDLRLELDPDLAPVKANRLQIEKVLVNLIENGIEALEGSVNRSGCITVTAGASADAHMAEVIVRDDGPGLDAAAMRRIFDPFFTTKPSGLGMGLAISRAIVDAHGGRLWCESEPGSGASFHLTLPFAT